MLAEVGGQAAQHLAVVPGMTPPTPEEVREATQRLKDVESRALDEFFWFWPENWEKPEADEAFAAVKRNDLDAAFGIWTRREVENETERHAVIASHNLALIFHMRALEWAHLDFAEPLPKERVVKVASYWEQAFDRWEWLATDERHWDAFKARIRQVNDPALTTGFARRLRSELPQAFDKINAELALTYAEKGRRVEAQWHVDFLKSTHAGTDDTESTIDVVLAPSRARLERAIESAHAASQSDKKSGISQAKKLLDTAEPLLAVFDMFHKSDSLERCQLFDEVAACALACAVIGYNIANTALQNAPPPSAHGLDPRKTLANSFLAVLRRAESLATDLDLRQRISQNIQTAEGNLSFDTKLKPLLDKLAAIQKLTTTSPTERLNRVKNEVIPLLTTLFQPGVLDRVAQQTIGNSIAIVLRGIALAANNDFHQPAVGMEALTLAVKYARDPELISRLKQDSQTMQQNLAAGNADAGDFSALMRRTMLENMPDGTRSPRSNSGQGCAWIIIGGFVLLVIIGLFDGGSKSKPTTYTPSRPTAPAPRFDYTPPTYTPQPIYQTPPPSAMPQPKSITPQINQPTQESSTLLQRQFWKTSLQRRKQENDAKFVELTRRFKQGVKDVEVDLYNAEVLQAESERDELANEISEFNSGRDMPERYKK